jgi:hypothetical protein
MNTLHLTTFEPCLVLIKNRAVSKLFGKLEIEREGGRDVVHQLLFYSWREDYRKFNKLK